MLTDKIFAALTSHGLKIPTSLVQLKVGDRVIGGSNLGNDARYDQTLHLPTLPENFTNHGGAVDFHIDDAHIDELFPGKNYTRDKFTLPNVRPPPHLDPDQDGHRRIPAQPDRAGGEGMRAGQRRASLTEKAQLFAPNPKLNRSVSIPPFF